MTTVLKINASARKQASTTRKLVDKIASKLALADDLTFIERDLTETELPLLTEEMVASFYTPPTDRTPEQKAIIAASDTLVAELQKADVLVIGAPIYNFSVPANLKAWIDLVARVGVTFQYSENGPKGLLEGKKAYIAIASGGTAFRSTADFASDYLKHFLVFLGIEDITFIAADQLMLNPTEHLNKAEAKIATIGA
ncbi:MAG: NAD(P)H-dependent oxidoreductase [Bacteroidota bacterium]